MATETERPKPPRPDGTDLSRYRGCERWTPRHWAWQFLRRNPRFQAACRRVADGDESAKQQVAAEFGLRRFKHFSEGYSAGGSMRPTFVAATPMIWSSRQQAGSAPEVRRVKLHPGQILVRFDLNSAIPLALGLPAQLRRAATLLDKRLNELRGGTKKPALRTPHTTSFLKYLRYLDMTERLKLGPQAALAKLNNQESVDSKKALKFDRKAKEYLEDYPLIAVMKTAQKGAVHGS
jgi:hypothetical protein